MNGSVGRTTETDPACPPDDATCSRLDQIVRFAATHFGVPIAIVSIIDEDTTIFRSRIGFPFARLPRGDTFCNETIKSDDLLVVPDALADPRFASCDLVRGTPCIRFYTGAPLVAPDGTRFGAIALIDTAPHDDFGEDDRRLLRELADSVMTALERDRLDTDLAFRQELGTIAAAAANLSDALDGILSFIARALGTLFCAVLEGIDANAFYRIMSSHTHNPAIQREIDRLHPDGRRPMAQLVSKDVFTDGMIVDSGPITEVIDPATHPLRALAYGHGLRRQLVFPLEIGARHFGIVFGFTTSSLPPRIQAMIGDLTPLIAPILQGRLREDDLIEANALLHRSNRGLETLLACAEAINRADDEAALTQSICESAVDVGCYTAAWIGMVEHDEARTLRPVAIAGPGKDELRNAQISWGDNPYGLGAGSTAVREGRLVVIDDILEHEALAGWHDHARRHGYRAVIALPLRDAFGNVFGNLTLLTHDLVGSGSPDNRRFAPEEIVLFEQLAAAVARGICALRMRAAHAGAVAEQHASEQRLARLLDASPTVVYALEIPRDDPAPANWRGVEFSSNLERLFGHTQHAALEPGWRRRTIHPDDRESAWAAERALLSQDKIVHRYRIARPDGVYRWINDEMNLHRDEAGRPQRVVGAWLDVTDQQLAEAEIHRLAYFDPLTGLPNRAMLRQHITTEIERARSTELTGAVLLVDLDGFKSINDLYGHAVGDIVLDQMGRRLQAVLRQKDMVARIGSDEFVVLLAGLADTADRAAAIAHRIADHLLAALAEPILAAGQQCQLGASIGIALFDATTGPDESLRQADIAMHQAKQDEAATIVFFESGMQDRVAERHTIEQALHDALAHRRFEVWLQSQVDRQDTIVAAEALIRLRRVDGSIMPPGDFIPIAEQTGLIVPIGRWILREICRILAEQAAAGSRLQLSVNVSPRQFRDPGFVADVLAALADAGADPHDLMIEITETLLIDRVEETTGTLNTLASHGVRFSVDDFGTGYSSLGYLQTLPIAEIKIDRRFISPLPDGARDATLAEAILAMTRHLGLITVAEGVETVAQAAFLRAHGCDVMQGYLFGRPEPAAAWLAHRTRACLGIELSRAGGLEA